MTQRQSEVHVYTYDLCLECNILPTAEEVDFGTHTTPGEAGMLQVWVANEGS